MQLKSVVLPARFGPMRPTISHSFTLSEASSSAARQPKRIEMLSSSNTDMSTARVRRMLVVVEGEPSAGEPSPDRADPLAEPAGVHDHRLQQQYGTDQSGN